MNRLHLHPISKYYYETFCLYILVVAPVTTHMKS